MRTFLLAALLLPLSACVETPEPPANCPTNDEPLLWGPPFWTLHSGSIGAQNADPLLVAPPTDPEQAYDVLLARKNQSLQIESITPPAGWTASSQVLGEHNTSNLLMMRARPGNTPQGDWLVIGIDNPGQRTDCPLSLPANLRVMMPEPARGQVASPGDGVLVYTAGFWENGTLFYTNMAIVDAMAWPKAGWYEFESDEPLPVYVYEEQSSEKPPHWSVCEPSSPITDGSCQWNYFVTIPGFNEALKGLSTNTARVVWVHPSQAYTREGNENHPLYGDAIVFYIRMVEVHEAPCGLPLPERCQLPP